MLLVLLAALGSAGALAAASSGSGSSPRSGSGERGKSASSPRANTGSSSSSPCGPQRASTLASSRTARVYSVKGIVYGCSNANRRPFRLGEHSRCSVDLVTVSGTLAAYGAERCGANNCASRVLVRRLSDDKVVGSFPAFTGPAGRGISATSVDSLVLNASGAVAWIASGCSIDLPPPDRQVYRAANHRQLLLDKGKTIVPRSLRLHGATLTWRHSRSTKSATLR